MNDLCCPPDEDLIPLLAGEIDGALESHLRECGACRHRLDVFRSDLDALRSVPLGGPPPEEVPSPRPAMIGKYLVVGTLGSGGQARVYRAVHPTLDQELAIKLSHRAVGKLSDHRPLMVAEGKVLARLDHPNLARVYDLDFHDDLPFLAMEYIRGPTLRHYAGDCPLPPRRAAEIVAEVAQALAVVHRHGVVHQDVKPQNILMDEADRPRLIDFGMARLRHAWDASGDPPTGGTPAFMAPEQARGETAAVGPRSDIFALGGVLYFLLTGKPPFQAADEAATLVLAGRCEFDRGALDRPGVTRRLRDICLRAMAPNPADRYARADDLAHDLGRFLTRPRRTARVVGGVVVGMLLVAAVGGLVSWRHPGPGPVPGPAPVVPSDAAHPALELVVTRGGQSLDLLKALPLEPAGDRVQVIARVPPGHHALLLHVNGNGKVKQLLAKESPADAYTRLVFPGDGMQMSFEPATPGTEVVLVFAAEKAEALEGLEDLVGSMLAGAVREDPGDPVHKPAGLPPLPAKTVVWLGRDEPQRQASAFGAAEPGPVAQVEHKLDHLRQRLREKPLSVIRGVAYSR
ncbi:MAG: stkP 4 [Gemmataceae bacterium]|nr:stkP 4 [Gemmataceae bacterium]